MNIMEIVVALIGLVGVIGATVIPLLFTQNKRLKKVQTQVQNGHQTNLRDDIDHLHATVINGFRDVNKRVDDIVTDLAWERRERIDLAERLTGVRPLG